MIAIKLFVSTFIFCICLDMIWLAWIAKDFYDNQIGFLLRKTGNTLNPHWGGAVVVYIAITLGIILFVLPKAQNNYLLAILYGSLFGFVGYAIYDFTNYSILAKWPLAMTLVDVIWGMFLCACTAAFCLMINKWLSA